MFKNFPSKSKKNLQYHPLDRDSDNESLYSEDDKSQEETDEAQNLETERTSKRNNRKKKKNEVNENIQKSSIQNVEYSALSSSPIDADDNLEDLNEDSTITNNRLPVNIELRDVSDLNQNSINEESRNEIQTEHPSTDPNYLIPDLTFTSSGQQSQESITSSFPQQSQTNEINEGGNGNSGAQVIQIDPIDQFEINPEDDDPLCHQVLLVFGMFCNYPFLWIIGAFLWCITPKSHHRSRMWGFINLVMSICFLIYLSIQTQRDPKSLAEDISLFPTDSKYTEKNRLRKSGFFSPGSYELKSNDKNIDFKNWVGFNSTTSIKISSKNLVEKSLENNQYATIQWTPAYNIIMGPQIKVSGRILFETIFTPQGNLDINLMNNLQKINCLDLENINITSPKSVFPSDNFFSNCNLTDEMIPFGFIGTGLRCHKSNHNVWALQWRPETFSDIDNYISSSIIYFEENVFCNIFIFSQNILDSNSTSYSNVKEILLRALPSGS